MLSDGEHHEAGWEDLGRGTPTVAAFARLCGDALARGTPGDVAGLSEEAQAILYMARERGVMEVKGTYNAFEAPERFLAVHVETKDGGTFVFRSRSDPRLTVRCLEGFRQLCAAGLVMHHLYCDFSLTSAGFELAATIQRDQIEVLERL